MMAIIDGYKLAMQAMDDIECQIGMTLGECFRRQIPTFVDCPKGFQGMRDTRYYCPTCKKLTRQREEYCHNCGQRVKYPKEVYNKENNRYVLDWSE